jgi:G3E family GTPase
MADMAILEDDDEAPPLLVQGNYFGTELTREIEKSDVVKAKVPITILTGFLGAGKTTLLNRLLRNCGGRRIAVVENEFGPGLDIEGLIAREGLSSNDGSDTGLTRLVELSNGCICCSVKDSLVAALEALIDRQPADKPLDHIVIETSGIRII